MKKFVSVFLVVVMVIGLLPVVPFSAWAGDFEESDVGILQADNEAQGKFNQNGDVLLYSFTPEAGGKYKFNYAGAYNEYVGGYVYARVR